jgi:glycosyltransferase involved in cell wall biosynthesis
VVIIAPKDNFTASLIAEGIDYYHINMNNYGTNPVGELQLYLQLVALYRKIKPDMIFHYTIKPNIYGTFAASWCGIPSIIITTGLGHLFEFKNFLVRWITLILYKYACRLSREVWFLNTNDLDVFTYKGISSREKSILVRSEGIDLNWFAPGPDKLVNEPIRFLFAGRLLRDKGVEEFAVAAAIMKRRFEDLEFQILGFVDETNPNSISYRRIIEWQQKGFVSYLGETTDVRPYMAACSCLVFPSYYREGVSRILMEAAAMETPIITADNVGCREVVDDGINGFICKPRDVQSLVKAMERFLKTDAADRIYMGKMGRKKMIREFDEKLVFESYDRILYKKIKEDVSILPEKKVVNQA